MEKLAYTIPGLVDATDGVYSRTRIYEDIKIGVLKAKKLGGRTTILAADAKSRLAELPEYQTVNADPLEAA